MIANIPKLNSVLLIDDDDVVNTLNTIILRHTEVAENIKAVRSGEHGIQVLSEYLSEGKWPAIIFVDINMPGIDGWEFLKMFDERFSAVRHKCIICLLSSSLDSRDRERASKTGLVDFYISKPLTFETVHEVVKKYNDLIKINQ